jgi:hypothetical protein
MTATKRKVRLFKGWWLLLIVLGALGVYTVFTFGAGAFLDDDVERRAAERDVEEAREWRFAWDSIGYAPAADADTALGQAEDYLLARQWQDAGLKARDAREGYAQAFAEEAQAVHNAVMGPWREQLLPRFPFNRDAEEDASLDLLTRQINPGTGIFFRNAERLERLARIEIRGLRVAPPPADYASVRAMAERLRAALFQMEDQPYFEFIAVTGGGVSMTVGHISASPGDYTTFRWEGEGATFRAPGVIMDHSESPWGLWRIWWYLKGHERRQEWLQVTVEDPSPLEPALFGH